MKIKLIHEVKVNPSRGFSILVSILAMLLLASVLEPAEAQVHDVAVTNLQPLKTVVVQGYFIRFNVTVENQGTEPATFNVTLNRLGTRRSLSLTGRAVQGWNSTIPGPTITANLYDDVRLALISGDGITHNFYVDYNGNAMPNSGEPKSPNFSSGTAMFFEFVANTTGTFTYYCNFHQASMHGTFIVNPTPTVNQIGRQQVALNPTEIRTLTFSWNTTGAPKGIYTTTADADVVAGETDIQDNTLIDSVFQVAFPGDVNADGKVDGKDIALVAKSFGTIKGQAGYVPNSDINDDGKIDGKDLAIASKYFGTIDP